MKNGNKYSHSSSPIAIDEGCDEYKYFVDSIKQKKYKHK